MSGTIDRPDIERVYALIQPYIRRTPVVEVAGADFGLAHARVAVKLELLQRAGSFKTRGAFANLLTHTVPSAGVVAASGGNHGAAVAFAAMQLKVPAKIFVPTISSPAKIDRIRAYGADLVVGGERYAEALASSEAWAAETGALQVHAFDQRETLLGQGTVGTKIFAGTFSCIAANATAAPWLPPDAATTPAGGTVCVSRFVNAPRVLNDPARCSSSSFTTTRACARPKSAPATSTTGVRRM